MSAFTYQILRYARTTNDGWRGFDTGTTNVVWGVDGDNAVFKNHNMWIKDQNSLYHLAGCYIVEGQTQITLDNTGYAYNSIP